MARKRKRNREKEERNTFIVSYTALAAILLAFFISINSMATITPEKVHRGIRSIRSSFSFLSGGKELEVPLSQSGWKVYPESDRLIAYLAKYVKRTEFGENIQLMYTKRGVVISMLDLVLFEPGSSELTRGAKELLKRVGRVISLCSNKVKIEGYTDDLKIKGGTYKDNWELSAARALSVMRYFVEELRLPPGRFAVVGYGEFHPFFPNDTPEHREMNRRIQIVLEGNPNFVGGFFRMLECGL